MALLKKGNVVYWNNDGIVYGVIRKVKKYDYDIEWLLGHGEALVMVEYDKNSRSISFFSKTADNKLLKLAGIDLE